MGTMASLKKLYRIGHGPSSSHTMGPRFAAEAFARNHPQAKRVEVTLHGSLAATGKGHLTDVTIAQALAPMEVQFHWQPNQPLPAHPNAMTFQAFDQTDQPVGRWRGYSIGGGEIRHEDEALTDCESVYPLSTMAELCDWTQTHDKPLWAIVEAFEEPDIWDYLQTVWQAMLQAIQRGLAVDDRLPGELNLQRKARSYHEKAQGMPDRSSARLSAVALAVSEENASGGQVVTAPTCGSCGVLPAVLDHFDIPQQTRLQALAIAGLVGNIVKTNASISGALVGCQGEVGVACSMAAAAGAFVMGASTGQIEYAAEMALEHHLGLTCDPVAGLVQIPCIERNAMAALRALDCAQYAILGDGSHMVSFDNVVAVMNQTGKDLPSIYRETAMGGLAQITINGQES